LSVPDHGIAMIDHWLYVTRSFLACAMLLLNRSARPTPVRRITATEPPASYLKSMARKPEGNVAEEPKEPKGAVEGAAAGQYAVNFNLDLNTGRVVGSHEALNALAPSGDALGQNILKAIGQALQKPVSDLADDLKARLAADDHPGTVSALREGRESGALAFPPTNDLLDSLMGIDVTTLSPEDRRFVRECRVAMASRLNRYDIAGAESEVVLNEHGGSLTAREASGFRMAIGIATRIKGNTDTALLIWRELLERPEDLGAEGRAWAWRNISMAVEADDPERVSAAKLSADAFLEAGNKEEAGKSLMHAAKGLLLVEPLAALETIARILPLIDQEGPRGRHLRAVVLHTRANRLSLLGRYKEALEDAREAVNLQRGLMGVETEFVSSLHLAAVQARALGNDKEAEEFEAEAAKFTEDFDLVYFKFAGRLTAIADAFDADAAAALIKDAVAAHQNQIVDAARLIATLNDPSLGNTERLGRMEEALKELDDRKGGNAMEDIVRLAIARILFQLNHLARAERQYRQVIRLNPFDPIARDHLVACLWRQEKWPEAADLLAKQIKLQGEMPALLFGWGKSLFEAGDIPEAIKVLHKAVKAGDGNDNAKKAARDLLERALDLGETLKPALATKDTTAPVTREEFEVAMDAFAKFVSADKRMSFWRKEAGDDDYRWSTNPEQRAQDLLEAVLHTAFGNRSLVIPERIAGAGRADLFVQLQGGLKVIVELKLCGFGYSSAYAASGEDQILHYMEQRETKLGYLVVLDARLTEFGPLLSTDNGPYTVINKLVDVRPRVKKAATPDGSKKTGKPVGPES
jgi:tetratricopeptide (TPR) repeat protein